MSAEWTHTGLRKDLARSRVGIGEAVIEELSLGFWGNAGSIDVWAMKLSRTRPQPTCYEVKISRADFLSDLRAEKFRRYEPFAERCYFATPAGMVERDEVPPDWGLIVRGRKGWHSLRSPRRSEMELAAWREMMLAVILAYHPGPWNEPPRAERLRRIADIPRDRRLYSAESKWLGRRVAAALRNGAVQDCPHCGMDLRA